MLRVVRHTIDDLLQSPDDPQLCDSVHGRLVQAMNAVGLDPAHDLERVIVLTWDAAGAIGNGRFEYLFEGRFFDRDPGYAQTLKGFEVIGATDAHAAFREALAWFPDSRAPADAEARLEHYSVLSEVERDRVNTRFWRSKEAYARALARYIREHRREIEELLLGHLRRGPPGVDFDDIIQRHEHLRLMKPGILEQLHGETVTRRFDLREWAPDLGVGRGGAGLSLFLRRGGDEVVVGRWSAMEEKLFSFIAMIVGHSSRGGRTP